MTTSNTGVLSSAFQPAGKSNIPDPTNTGTGATSYTGAPSSSFSATDPNVQGGYTNPATPTTGTYSASQQTVDPNMTTSGQLANALKAGSPLVDAAQAQTNQQYNARGLLNSSMGATAATDAAINTALPIAQGDAQANQQVSAANQAATNTEQQFNVGTQNQAVLAGQQGQIQSGLSKQAAGQQAGLQQQQGVINSALTAQQGTQQSGLAAQQEGYTQANTQYTAQVSQATSAFMSQLNAQQQQIVSTSAAGQGAVQQMQQQIASILADPNTAAADKQGLINQVYTNTQNALTAIGSVMNLDFSKILPSGVGQTPTPSANPAPDPNNPSNQNQNQDQINSMRG